MNSLRRQIYGLASKFNGQATRQGSLYPPTETHKMRKARLEAELLLEVEGIRELEAWVREDRRW